MVAAPWCGYTTLSPTSNVMPLLAHPASGRRGEGSEGTNQDTRAGFPPLLLGTLGVPSRPAGGPTVSEERLDAIELLGSLPRLVQDELRPSLTTRRYARNNVLFRQGDPASEMFGVL